MAVNVEFYKKLLSELKEKEVTLVAVSKTKSVEDIRQLYDLGQRDFGENYVQELVDKYPKLPKDIRWHFIGHLQSNKVKLIAPFISVIHSVDSKKLLMEIDKEASKNKRIIDCLLQVYIAREETKFGLDTGELKDLIQTIRSNAVNLKEEKIFKNICIKGWMGMASFTENTEVVRNEFMFLKSLFDNYSQFSNSNFQLSILSMGMSADYKIAIEEGSNMVRIGSLLFGKRERTHQ